MNLVLRAARVVTAPERLWNGAVWGICDAGGKKESVKRGEK